MVVSTDLLLVIQRLCQFFFLMGYLTPEEVQQPILYHLSFIYNFIDSFPHLLLLCQIKDYRPIKRTFSFKTDNITSQDFFNSISIGESSQKRCSVDLVSLQFLINHEKLLKFSVKLPVTKFILTMLQVRSLQLF